MNRASLVLLLSLLFPARAAFAEPIAGVEVASEARVANRWLPLNGAGVLTRFGLRIYVAGLYVPEPSAQTSQLLATEGPRRVDFHFLFPATSGQVERSIRRGMLAHAGEPTAELLSRIETFCGNLRNMSRGQIMSIAWEPDRGTTLAFDGEEVVAVEGRDFADLILQVLVGDHPESDSLKSGLLGG